MARPAHRQSGHAALVLQPPNDSRVVLVLHELLNLGWIPSL